MYCANLIELPVSQRSPVNPGMHLHMNPVAVSLHSPLKHGLGLHSDRISENISKKFCFTSVSIATRPNDTLHFVRHWPHKALELDNWDKIPVTKINNLIMDSLKRSSMFPFSRNYQAQS